MPVGGIILWSGNSKSFDESGSGIGTMVGWAICNGNNGTPDLQDQFVVGAGNSYTPSQVGGSASVTLSINQMPGHTHGINDPGHSHKMFHGSVETGKPTGNWQVSTGTDSPDARAYTGITINTSGGGAPFDNRPPYFALYYIMKIS